jgi:shikimate kinase
MGKIYLIGMPGSGKSTFGQKLADELQLPFIDLDREIEREEGTSVSIIFSSRGESYFREVESKWLRSWASSKSSFVMATGGGAPCFHNGIRIINESGISVFLDVPARELIRRLEHENHRPLIPAEDKEKKIEELLATRLSFYNKAKLRADPLQPIEKIIGAIRNLLESNP